MVFRIEVSFKEVIGMKSLKAVALLLVIENVAGSYVNQLGGNIQLLDYDSRANFVCRGGSTCRIPTVPIVFNEIERMKETWQQGQSYNFSGTTQIRTSYDTVCNYDLYGLESPCFKRSGEYYCSIMETNMCYITVRLGFEVVYGQAYTSRTTYGVGRNTIQVKGFGSYNRMKQFEITCAEGARCLKDEVTLLGLLYTNNAQP